ncbi:MULTISPECIES: PilW family protein [unclassified Massilia]|uniref:PilW family protein n=1 Tax=unclassified Massilia TaxID=2609279 RepID=UPI00177F704F|nr:MULTISPECIES: pilus assembly protein PilW [unclassified Massilia]MBD8530166.1 pilus assembly protein PilW [Massilia sp. CFBP 13647]MBD8674005.1 pilus assembly protein PilW [Massilia sp. CFBP 13721]
MRTNPRTGGFSVVELLVSLVIGLLALGFATRLVTGSEQAKSAALGSSDSMQNGMLAMFSISGDAQQAGFGLNDPILLGCDTRFVDNEGFVLADAPRGAATVKPLAAAIIESGGTGSDRISLYSGSSLSGTGTVRMITNYIGGTNLDLDRQAYGFANGDVVVVAPEDRVGKCALTQVSEAPGTKAKLSVAGGSGLRYATGSLGRNFSGGTTRVFNLGPAAGLSLHTWSVANGFLRLRATDMAGAAAAPATVADNIVSIKAQYGFDTRTGGAFAPKDGLRVGKWSATMIDADGDGEVGGAGDYEHMAALRIAVVARSKTRERPNAAGACGATAVLPTVFASAEPFDVTPVPIKVDVAVAGEGDSEGWRCYRYRVFETIVPLKNALWRP